MVIDAITDLVIWDKIVDDFDGRFLAGGIARLVEAAAPGAVRKVYPKTPTGPGAPAEKQQVADPPQP